jgi:hypothetical protein
VADDLIPVLTRFHREVLLPDLERIVGEAVGELRGEMNAHFDAIHRRFDRLETAALEARVDGRESQTMIRIGGIEDLL